MMSAEVSTYDSFSQEAIEVQEVQFDTQTLPESPLKENTLEEYKDDDAFNYQELEAEENSWGRLKQWLTDLGNSIYKYLFGSKQAGTFMLWIINNLVYILLGILLIAIVWIFIKIDTRRLSLEKIKAPESYMGDEEDIIQNQDIQALINQALAENDYRLAVRYYYLLALQKLSGKEYIQWEAQKTNHDYIFEIEDQVLRYRFTHITSIYDYIWYGNFHVDTTAFAKAETAFKELNQSL